MEFVETVSVADTNIIATFMYDGDNGSIRLEVKNPTREDAIRASEVLASFNVRNFIPIKVGMPRFIGLYNGVEPDLIKMEFCDND